MNKFLILFGLLVVANIGYIFSAENNLVKKSERFQKTEINFIFFPVNKTKFNNTISKLKIEDLLKIYRGLGIAGSVMLGLSPVFSVSSAILLMVFGEVYINHPNSGGIESGFTYVFTGFSNFLIGFGFTLLFELAFIAIFLPMIILGFSKLKSLKKKFENNKISLIKDSLIISFSYQI